MEKPRCGLCGKTTRLMKTECCGNWICDDEEDYVPFSYTRNSCARNHRRLTICAYHHAEGHQGDWKDCEECRKEFPTEMYVWYATNEYNFEKLKNPPSYKPTRCAICGRRIRLGTDGFTQSGKEYWCESCARRKVPGASGGNVFEMFSEKTDSQTGRVKVGRNDPCPCGSGKKYKRCCLGKEEAGEPQEAGLFGGSRDADPIDALEELRELMKDQDFKSLEEMQAFVDSHMGVRNLAPVEGFQGLSPDQMHRFIQFPFSSPDLAAFCPCLVAPPEAPAVKLFTLIVNAMGEKGLKATAKGNLPLGLVREAADGYFSDEQKRIRGGMRSEMDFFDLHVTRLVGGLAGLIRKYQGRFLPTAKLGKLMAHGGMAAIYPSLLRAFAEKFNWGYADHYPEFPIIQHSFLFSLRLFHQFGEDWKPSIFYEDCFISAFPMVLDEAEWEQSYWTPEETVRHCFTLRCLERFGAFFGLLEIERESGSAFDHRIRVRNTRLLDEAVNFKV